MKRESRKRLRLAPVARVERGRGTGARQARVRHSQFCTSSGERWAWQRLLAMSVRTARWLDDHLEERFLSSHHSLRQSAYPLLPCEFSHRGSSVFACHLGSPHIAVVLILMPRSFSTNSHSA